jgi:hypothetical protein
MATCEVASRQSPNRKRSPRLRDAAKSHDTVTLLTGERDHPHPAITVRGRQSNASY